MSAHYHETTLVCYVYVSFPALSFARPRAALRPAVACLACSSGGNARRSILTLWASALNLSVISLAFNRDGRNRHDVFDRRRLKHRPIHDNQLHPLKLNGSAIGTGESLRDLAFESISQFSALNASTS